MVSKWDDGTDASRRWKRFEVCGSANSINFFKEVKHEGHPESVSFHGKVNPVIGISF
jgi:hypothetical protein